MKKMSDIKIMAPVSNKISMLAGIENGADEFFFGISSEVHSKNKWFLPNRRHDEDSNFKSIASAVENIRTAHFHGKKAHLTLNSHFYQEGFYETFLITISNIIKHEPPDSIIVSDLNLILLLRINFPEIPLTASTICGVYNSRSAAFYSRLGIKRIILPRHVSVSEAAEIVSKNPQVEFECFCMFGECANIEGMCGNIGSFGWPCTCPVLQPLPEEGQKDIAERYVSYSRRRMGTCRACDILALSKAGIGLFKIVGREETEEKIIQGIVFMKRLINLDESFLKTDEAFQNEAIRLYKQVFGSDCHRQKCYIAPLDMEKYGE